MNKQQTRKQPRRMRGFNRFAPTEKVSKEVVKEVLKRIWGYMKAYPKQLTIVVVSIIFTSAFNLALPSFLKIIIDNYLDVNVVDINRVLLISIATIVGTAIIGIFSFLQFFVIAKVASLATKQIRRDAFNHLTRLPISYFDNNPHGDIISKLTNDTETILNVIARVVPQFVVTIITIIGATILMLITSWQLTIIIGIVIILMLIATTFISKGAQKHFIKQQDLLGQINGIVEEDVVGLEAVKLYNQEENMINKFTNTMYEYRDANFRGHLYAGMLMPMVRLIDNILYGLIIAVGAVLNINYGAITIGGVQAMTNYSRITLRPLNNLSSIFNIIQIAIAGGKRIFDIIDEIDEYEGVKDKTLPEVKGNVSFENVIFEYEEDTEVLRDVSFKANAGETIAIVGPTGSGKTTIINLLTRFYDTNSGDIKIDGVSIYELSKDFLRRNIGIVLQTTYLFKGTVYENIKYGKPDASREDVIKAAKLAQVHEIIERLPNKYNTRVKEGGLNFSHGERQLLSIARTILSDPAILVLDEATSSVDTRTEERIQKSMDILTKDRTSFVIAHRLKTIKNADKIIVIRDGKILEEGNHDQLIKEKGLYHQMYTTQFDLDTITN